MIWIWIVGSYFLIGTILLWVCCLNDEYRWWREDLTKPKIVLAILMIILLSPIFLLRQLIWVSITYFIDKSKAEKES